ESESSVAISAMRAGRSVGLLWAASSFLAARSRAPNGWCGHSSRFCGAILSLGIWQGVQALRCLGRQRSRWRWMVALLAGVARDAVMQKRMARKNAVFRIIIDTDSTCYSLILRGYC